MGPAEKGTALRNLGRNLGMRKPSRSISRSIYSPRSGSILSVRQPPSDVCPPREAEQGKIIPMILCMSQVCHLEQKTWVKSIKEWLGIYLQGLLANDWTGQWTSHLREEMTKGSSYPLALYKASATWVPIYGLRISLKHFNSISSITPE